MKRLLMPAVLVFAIAVLGVGCGDDDGGGADTAVATSSLSKDEYVQQVDQICERGREERSRQFIEQAKQSIDEGKSRRLFEEVTEEVLVPLLGDQIEEIRDLGAPSGDEQQVEAVLAAMARAKESLEAEPVTEIAGYPERMRRAIDLMRRYGIEACDETR